MEVGLTEKMSRWGVSDALASSDYSNSYNGDTIVWEEQLTLLLLEETACSSPLGEILGRGSLVPLRYVTLRLMVRDAGTGWNVPSFPLTHTALMQVQTAKHWRLTASGGSSTFSSSLIGGLASERRQARVLQISDNTQNDVS